MSLARKQNLHIGIITVALAKGIAKASFLHLLVFSSVRQRKKRERIVYKASALRTHYITRKYERYFPFYRPRGKFSRCCRVRV
jgi:hypothetical protein